MSDLAAELSMASFDRFHSKADRTYRVTAAARRLKVAFVPVPVGPALQDAIPEVVHNTRVWREGGVLFQKGELTFEEPNTFYVEPCVVDVFDRKSSRNKNC